LAACADAFDGLINFGSDTRSFINHNQNMAGVEALEAARIICGETDGIVLGPEPKLGRSRHRKLDYPAHRGTPDGVLDFAPNDFFHLQPGRSGGYNDSVAMRCQPPEHGDRYRVGFTAGVARLRCYPAMLCDGGEDIALRLPEIRAEYYPGEENRIAQQRTSSSSTWFWYRRLNHGLLPP
jgi:hypothetical protein